MWRQFWIFHLVNTKQKWIRHLFFWRLICGSAINSQESRSNDETWQIIWYKRDMIKNKETGKKSFIYRASGTGVREILLNGQRVAAMCQRSRCRGWGELLSEIRKGWTPKGDRRVKRMTNYPQRTPQASMDPCVPLSLPTYSSLSSRRPWPSLSLSLSSSLSWSLSLSRRFNN